VHAVSQLPAVVYARLLPRLGQGAHDASVVPSHAVAVVPAAHTAARAPGANDAVVAMYTLSKMMRDHMLPHSGTWTLNETILASGQATADNLAAQMSMIMFAARCPDVAMLKKIYAVLDRNAEAAAAAAHCTVKRHWVSKSKPGLANHAMAEITFRNLERAGAPRYGAEAVKAAQALQDHDAVFVPALDGGYVLVGQRVDDPRWFAGMAWSHAQVMADTRVRLRAAGVRWAELAPLADIDAPADLHHLPPGWLPG
jgi:glycosyltransferase A (GT-A) superfamily protein (DUF2064 family)